MFSLVSIIAFFAFTNAQVPELNRSQYLGRWYQAYSDFAVEATFENNSFCVTADYDIYPNNTISVLNRERQYNISGPERRVLGWADVANASAPGELTVYLQTTSGFGAPYWVYELGPATYNGSQYQYSVVSDPLKFTLFVLARNLTEFAATWASGVLQRLKENGFTEFWNTPIATVQENCEYWVE
jgi:apolipoprotein D and lipocalin family protein